MQRLVEYQQRLIDLVNQNRGIQYPAANLSPQIVEAVMRCPRHLFLTGYKLYADDNLRTVGDPPDEQALQDAYADRVIFHVGSDGSTLASTNSQPSFVLDLVERLQLKPGHRVLEVGSGGGWLAAIMGCIVGPTGSVTGIEIIEDLAVESSAAIGRLNINNVRILSGNGASGHISDKPFDRVIFTAGVYDLAADWFEQVQEGGLLMAPFRLRGGGNDLILLKKSGGQFISLEARLAYFVPLADGRNDIPPLRMDDLQLYLREKDRPSFRVEAPFGGSFIETFAHRTTSFRSYLQKLDTRFQVFQPPARLADASPPLFFGLYDERAQSLAIWKPHEIVGYGDRLAAHDLLRAYRSWADSFMPAADAFDLTITHRSREVPPRPRQLIEDRGESLFCWELKAKRSFNDLVP